MRHKVFAFGSFWLVLQKIDYLLLTVLQTLAFWVVRNAGWLLIWSEGRHKKQKGLQCYSSFSQIELTITWPGWHLHSPAWSFRFLFGCVLIWVNFSSGSEPQAPPLTSQEKKKKQMWDCVSCLKLVSMLMSIQRWPPVSALIPHVQKHATPRIRWAH